MFCSPIPTCVVGSPPPSNSRTPAGCPQFNSVLVQSTWRWHQIPQVRGSVPQNCPPHFHLTLDPSQDPRLLPITSHWLAVNQRFSRPLLGLDQFARSAHRTQETIDYWCIMKGNNSGNNEFPLQHVGWEFSLPTGNWGPKTLISKTKIMLLLAKRQNT